MELPVHTFCPSSIRSEQHAVLPVRGRFSSKRLRLTVHSARRTWAPRGQRERTCPGALLRCRGSLWRRARVIKIIANNHNNIHRYPHEESSSCVLKPLLTLLLSRHFYQRKSRNGFNCMRSCSRRPLSVFQTSKYGSSTCRSPLRQQQTGFCRQSSVNLGMITDAPLW